MSLPRIASYASHALPSYQALAGMQPPSYPSGDTISTLSCPAPAYTAPVDRYAQSAHLEAGLGLVLQPPTSAAPQTTSAIPTGVNAIATLGCIGGAGLVAFTLPAIPGIVMVALGHKRHNAALQWVGVGWLGVVCLLIGYALLGNCRPQARRQAGPGAMA